MSTKHEKVARLTYSATHIATALLTIALLACPTHAEPPTNPPKKDTTAKSNDIDKRKSTVRDLVAKLKDPSNEVREKAAASLRPLLAADPASAPNWHEQAFWAERIEATKSDMPLNDALAVLLPDSSPKERQKQLLGSDWSGGTGTSMYQLDDYWRVHLQLRDHDQPILLERPQLFASVRQQWVEPPKNFTGTWTTWHVNGQRANEIQYRDGKYHGTFTSFHDNGAKLNVQHYEDGHCDGADVGWYKSGQKMYEGQYKNDKQNGTWRHWHENGQLSTELTYNNGRLDGSNTSWFASGQKQYEERYRNGKKEGRGAAWDDQGKLLWDREYRNNEVVDPGR